MTNVLARSINIILTAVAISIDPPGARDEHTEARRLMSETGSQPAFPHMCCGVLIDDELRNDPRIKSIKIRCESMTLRQYAAFHIMQGLVSSGTAMTIDGKSVGTSPQVLAASAWAYADTLLAAEGKDTL